MSHNHITKFYKWNFNSVAHYLHKVMELKFCANTPLKLSSVNAQYNKLQ